MPGTDPTDPPPPFATVIVSAVDCADGTALTNCYFKNLKNGQLAPFPPGDSLIAVLYAYPGFQFEVSRAGYVAQQHTLTSQEVTAKFAEVCLAAAVPPPNPPGGPVCLLNKAFRTERQIENSAEPVLSLFRGARDIALTTKRGTTLVDRFYSAGVTEAISSALDKYPSIRIDLVMFLFELAPFLNEINSQPARATADSSPVLRPDVAGHGIRVLEAFRELTAGAVDAEIDQAIRILEYGSGRSAGEILTYLSSSSDQPVDDG
jgi:hypothetical protein